MAPPKGLPVTRASISPEIAPPSPSPEDKKKTPEAIAATAAETKEAGKIEVQAGAKRKRADISLDTLAQRAKLHSVDAKTAESIDGINFRESGEVQRERLEDLNLVGTMVVANILVTNPDLEKRVNLGDLSGFSQLTAEFEKTNPGPGEKAAFHKLLESLQHPESDAAKYIKNMWAGLLIRAKSTANTMMTIRDFDFSGKKEKNGPIKWICENKLLTGLIAGAALFIGYKIFKKIRGGSEQAQAPGQAPQATPEKKSGFWKWTIGIGATILSLFGFFKLMGAKGTQEWFNKKFGWNIDSNRFMKFGILLAQGKWKEAGETLWSGIDEKADLHAAIADTINKQMSSKVTGKTIFGLKDEKYEDFLSSISQTKDKISKGIGDYMKENDHLLGSILPIDSPEENKAQMAIRGFLKKHEQWIRTNVPIRKSTTVGEVLNKLHEHLKQAQVASPSPAPATGSAGVKGPETAAVSAAAGAAAVAALGNKPGETKGHSPISGALESQERASDRDQAREKLGTPEKKKMAVERENFLMKKISAEQINKAKESIAKREETLRDLLTKNLKPNERKAVEFKLETLLNQADELTPLIQNHEETDGAYLAALNSNLSDELLTQKFVALVGAKEMLERHIDEIFERTGWAFVGALAVTHSMRILTFAYNRYVKYGDVRIENANYLFGKYKDKLRPSQIKESIEKLVEKVRRRIPRTTLDIATLKGRTDSMFGEMQNFIDVHHEGTQPRVASEVLTKEHLARLNTFEREISMQQSHLDHLWTIKTKELEAAVKSGNRALATTLTDEVRDIGKELVRFEAGAAGKVQEAWSRGWKGVGGKPEIAEEGVSAFRGLFRRIVKEVPGTKHSSKVLLRKGRMIFLAGSIAIPGIIGGELLADDKTSKVDAYKQAGLSAVPLVGTYLDFYSLCKGKEKFTGRKLDTTDRVVAGLFGVTGIATDVLSVFGIGLVGKGALMALRTGKGLSRAARVAKVVEAAKDAKTAARATKVARYLENTGKWGFRVSLGTALGSGAYMAFREEADVPVDPDFQAQVLGDETQQVAEPEAPGESGSQVAAAA